MYRQKEEKNILKITEKTDRQTEQKIILLKEQKYRHTDVQTDRQTDNNP
jgi:hypothetical protein